MVPSCLKHCLSYIIMQDHYHRNMSLSFFLSLSVCLSPSLLNHLIHYHSPFFLSFFFSFYFFPFLYSFLLSFLLIFPSFTSFNSILQSFLLSCLLFDFLHALNWCIGLVSRLFTNGLGDQGSIPCRVIPKTQKMVLDTSMLNTLHYKVCIKGKWSNPEKVVVPYPTPQCSSYWKGSLQVTKFTYIFL